jgi:spermidine/putrescine transport system ATP-binding protein
MSAAPGIGEIVLEHVSKSFGSVVAVNDVAFTIPGGSFFSMLGPSGCGKTTTLRMIAGFEEPDRGRVLLQDQDITWVPPAKRPVNMVFQAYGLFPHMTVKENIEFGLRIKHMPRAEMQQRVTEMLAIVRLEGLERRRPAQLSGGQQQRVALARALVNRPAALLLDEPLGALDLKLRKEMQLELKRLQTETQTTFVYVTHDQEEALTMSDWIAVMNGGVVEQLASPREIYGRPATPFVAGFIGTSNLLALQVDERDGDLAVMRLADGERILAHCDLPQGSQTQITVRPEKIKIGDEGRWASDSCEVSATVTDVVYLGSTTQIAVELATGERLVVDRLNDDDTAPDPAPGTRVTLHWAAEHSFVIGGEPPSARSPQQVEA